MAVFILKYRNYIIAIAAILGIIFLVFIPFSKTDPDIRNYIPSSMESGITTDSIETVFGYQDMIVLLFTDTMILNTKDLTRIRDTDRGLSRLGSLSDRISPFTVRTIRSTDGMMVVEPLIRGIPRDSAGLNRLKHDIRNNSFAEGIVFSHDLKAAAITVKLNDSEPESEILFKIDSICGTGGGNTIILKGGLPVIRMHILKDVKKDAVLLIPAALLIMLLVLKLSLGDWKSVIIPFSVVVISSVVSMGLIPVLGWKLSVISLLVPIILIAVANNYGIYLVTFANNSYAKDPGLSDIQRTGRMMQALAVPVLFSGLTTIAGTLGLLTHSVTPARQVGILASAGVLMALLLSLFFIPAMISKYHRKMQVPVYEREKNNLAGLTFALANIVRRHPQNILLVAGMVILIISSGIFFLRIETNQENFFPAGNPVRRASAIINDKFGGSQTISVMISGDIKDPDIMRGIDVLSSEIKGIHGVGDVYSISLAVKEMSKALFNPGDSDYNNIPVTREGIAQMFELYYMSGDQGDFRQLMNAENDQAHILVKLSDPSDKVIGEVKRKISEFIMPGKALITTGGYAIIMADFARLIFRGQVISLLVALILVLILLTLIFHSWRTGIICSIPLASSILILYGFMGYAGIAIDSATALLSSIMIGVGVDFTIQFMWHIKALLSKGLSYEESVTRAMPVIGRSIIINAFALISGFSVLIFSGFSSIRFFGYLVMISVSSCLAGALILIPAILIRFKPAYLIKQYRFNEFSDPNVKGEQSPVKVWSPADI